MIRAFQWDLARQVERIDVLLRLLPKYAEWGYSELYLHLEDAVHYPSLPGVARADAYTTRELSRLVEAATKSGIAVVPIVNLLGHTQYLIKTPALRDLNELRAADGMPLDRGQICPLHPRIIEVAEKLLADMAPFCTSGKVHAGLDESFHLGRCPRCRDEIARSGLGAHFANHVDRMHTLASGLGLRMGIWADMLNLVPEAIPLLPRDLIAYDWYYYPFKRHPRVELYNFAENDLAGPLRRQGIEYWGCPMNGAFRYEPLPVFRDRLANLRSWWRRCEKVGADGFLVTSWESYRLAFELTTVIDAAAASLWLEGAPESDQDWLARGFERVSGKATARTAARAALSADEYPYSGYAKWELNQRWDCAASAATGELSRFRRLVAKKNPPPLSSSLSFRLYLAERESFVSACQQAVKTLRRTCGTKVFQDRIRRQETKATAFAKALRSGRAAARAMWRRTRNPALRGQNETILDADQARLAGWRSWLRDVRRDPGKIFTASPVLGTWQLAFTVHNFAPALQRVVVSQRDRNGSWVELAGRHTIEFLAEAAAPRSGTRRAYCVSVAGPDALLKISVHGLGQVAVENPMLTDGLQVLRPRAAARRRIIGRPAPKSGFPNLAQEPGKESEIELAFPRSGEG